MIMFRRSSLLCATLVLATLPAPSRSASHQDDDLAAVLAQAGERVEAFLARAQSLVCTETASLQPLNAALSAEGFSRTVESELRLSWDPGGEGEAAVEALTRRQVLKVNGRPPREKDHRSCTTPEQQDTETQPLSMLLPQQREGYAFTAAGTGRLDGRTALQIDYRELRPLSTDVRAVEGLDDCVSYDIKGGWRGRVWIDADTFDVLRLDQRLTGLIDLRLPRVLARRPGASPYMTIERADTSLRFGRVSFSDPDESLILPQSATELRVMRGASRLRTSIRYSNYKRFLTGGRVVGP